MQQYFVDIWNQINAIVVGHPAKKDKFCEHIQKVILKAEKYWQYLQDERQKPKDILFWWDVFLSERDMEEHVYFSDDEDTSFHCQQHIEKNWFLYDVYVMDWEWGNNVYFPDEEFYDRFYIEEQPKPDPLSYLYNMIWGAAGQEYEGLELLDYQFTLLAIIYDAQNWPAGRERIYFNYNRSKRENLKERLCHAVWDHLEKYDNWYDFRPVKQTIETAMLTVRAELDREKESTGTEAKNRQTVENNLQEKVLLGNGMKGNIKKQQDRGRKKIKGTAEKKRLAILEHCQRAKESGVARSDCLDDLNKNGIDIDGELQKVEPKVDEKTFRAYRAWNNKRHEREMKNQYNKI